MSLIYGIKWPGSLFGAVGVSGLANVELTPEFALKLGQALGSVDESRHERPHEPRRASGGARHESLRHLGAPVGRHPRRRFAGVTAAARALCDAHRRRRRRAYARRSERSAFAVLIEVMDASGINIDKPAERKIENLFFREDFQAHGHG